MKILKFFLALLFPKAAPAPEPVAAPAPIPAYQKRHFEAQDAGAFDRP